MIAKRRGPGHHRSAANLLKMEKPILFRFGSAALDRVKSMLEFSDYLCSAVLSVVPIQDGVCHGFFAPGAREWLGEDRLESCLPVSREELLIGEDENRRFIAEYLAGGEPDRICLLYSPDCDKDPGIDSLGFPFVFLDEAPGARGKAVWHFLQGPHVSVEDADDAIRWASEWPAIHILTRTGLAESVQARSELAPELISELAKNTQFIMVGAFDCGERLIWSRSEEAFREAASWFWAEDPVEGMDARRLPEERVSDLNKTRSDPND